MRKGTLSVVACVAALLCVAGCDKKVEVADPAAAKPAEKASEDKAEPEPKAHEAEPKAETKKEAPDPVKAAEPAEPVKAAPSPAAAAFAKIAAASPTGEAAAKPSKRAEATVKAVYYRGPEGPQASGGTSAVTVRIEPNSSGQASVGVVEEFMGGTGSQWKAATWMAAFTASHAVGRHLTDYEFLVKSGGHIDGPSAGMLVTATMMALMRGDTVREDSTMSGTVNPDGTAGPVGGLPQKMQGAKADGKTRFGFPVGTRRSRDLQTGQMVDLVDYGKSQGLEAVEIRDYWQAYEFLTGKKLPRTAAIDESKMEPPSDVSAKLKAKALRWKSSIDGDLPVLKQKAAQVPANVAQLIQPTLNQAQHYYTRAETFESNGMLAAAYHEFFQAAVMVSVARHEIEFLEPFAKADIDGMLAKVQSMAAVEGKLKALESELAVAARSKTVGGQVNTTRAYTTYSWALGYSGNGGAKLNAVLGFLQKVNAGQANIDQAAKAEIDEALFGAVFDFAAAEALIEAARDETQLGAEQGNRPALGLGGVDKLAKAYGSAAGAGLSYFDSLFTEQVADHAGVTKQAAEAHVAQMEPDYDFLKTFVLIAERAERVYGKGEEVNLIRLAAGATAYVGAAKLVNKYYSLGARPQQDGSFTLDNRKALTFQLDAGRRSAREAAALVDGALGFVPAAAQLEYQLGVAKREGNDEDKLQALEHFWASAFWSNLALGLAKQG